MAYNISTAIDGNAVDLDIVKATAAADDEVFAVIYANGESYRTFKCANLAGGSADQLAISAGVKYTMKLSAPDALGLLGKTGTYALFKRTAGAFSSIESGTLNVGTGESLPATPEEIKLEVVKVTETFTANGTFSHTFADSAILAGIIVENTGANRATIDVTVDSVSYANDIAVASGETKSFAVTSESRAIPKVTDVAITAASWTGVEIQLTLLVWK